MNAPHTYERIRRLMQSAGGRSSGMSLDGVVLPLGTDETAELPTPPERRYRTLVGVDITGFGNREEHIQYHLRTTLYTLFEGAFAYADVEWPAHAWRDDRGDGVLVVVPPDATHAVLDPLVRYLHAGLRRHNKVSSEAAQILLRMAVHGGFVYRDDHGITGDAIVRLYRLLEAPSFKDAVRGNRAPLGVVVSQEIYNSVVRHGPGLIDPETYRRIPIVNKETRTEAWLHLPSGVQSPVNGRFPLNHAPTERWTDDQPNAGPVISRTVDR
jgi:hypothetical protein